MTIFPEQGHWRTASHGPSLLHFLEHTAQGSQMVLSDWFLTEALICHLRWVLLPPEVQLLGDFLCDRRCSQEGEEDISAMSWYKHVLPQLRHRWLPIDNDIHVQHPLLKLTCCKHILLLQTASNCSFVYRKFYGNKVKEFVLGPGETLYLPVFPASIFCWYSEISLQRNFPHAVMNIDENLSVTENHFLPDSLDDWLHGWAFQS